MAPKLKKQKFSPNIATFSGMQNSLWPSFWFHPLRNQVTDFAQETPHYSKNKTTHPFSISLVQILIIPSSRRDGDRKIIFFFSFEKKGQKRANKQAGNQHFYPPECHRQRHHLHRWLSSWLFSTLWSPVPRSIYCKHVKPILLVSCKHLKVHANDR